MSRRPFAAAWRSVLAFFAFTFFALAAHSQTLPTAQTVFNNITVGWNLGNTLEAQCGETAWGNPATSQALINAVKAAGFNAIRIPAAWNCHTNPSGSTTIDSAWMARVKQVVDYAYGQNMYVILNIHWDGGWLEEHPLYANQVANNQRQAAFWTQIATTFRDYNERMMFAGTNEVHADYGTPTAEHIEVQQSYNQTFVNAVRATGGNNASRTLVVQTYNTNIWHGINFFSLPTDTIANRLIVEVHHYDPYDYTLNPSGSCLYWGAPYPAQGACTWGQEAYVDDLFNQARIEWVTQGIPVIVGEYGVATRPNLNMESRNYYLRYNNEAAYRNGIKTFYWDTGVLPSQSNGFALFNRNTGAIVDQGALDARKTTFSFSDLQVAGQIAQPGPLTVRGAGGVTYDTAHGLSLDAVQLELPRARDLSNAPASGAASEAQTSQIVASGTLGQHIDLTLGAVALDAATLDPIAGGIGGRQRDALAEGVDLGPVGMGDGAGGDGDLGYATEEVGGHLVREAVDHGLEI